MKVRTVHILMSTVIKTEPYLDHNLMPVLLISLFCIKNQLGESELGERELGERELGESELGALCTFCLASQNPPQP